MILLPTLQVPLIASILLVRDDSMKKLDYNESVYIVYTLQCITVVGQQRITTLYVYSNV